MEYVIVLYFDNDASIQRLINKIGKKIINYTFINKIKPHLTLLSFEADDEDTLIKNFNKVKSKPIEILLSKINIFQETKNVIFIDCILSNDLLDLRSKFLKIPHLKLLPYHLLSKYHPHITIGYDLKESELHNAIKLVKNEDIPKRLLVSTISLYRFPDLFHLASINLSNR